MNDERIPTVNNDDLEKILIYFPQLIQAIELNHKNTFLNYLIDREVAIKISDNKIEGLRNGQSVSAEFDDIGRLTSLNGQL